MKIIAYYLPQFHEVEENNIWWGKGFTEWVNVKNSKSLFKNHCQPKEPLNENYYNLEEKKSREWQANLAKEYGIYGFCYYHYWFKGKKILEKPLENMLKDGEPNINFCLCWANEPWTRSWDGKQKSILIDQDYGIEKDWEEHIKYLAQFFKHKNYIFKENKPIFLIYRMNSIENREKMFNYYDMKIKEYGFEGIYFIEMQTSFQKGKFYSKTRALTEFEPMYTLKYSRNIIEKSFQKLTNKVSSEFKNYYSYEKVWQKILKRDKKRKLESIVTYPGGFVDWDNTPRKKEKGFVLKGASPEIFERYLREHVKKNSSDFMFINAWNEWAEGTYLEPDTKNGKKYLEKIKGIINED